jgi:Ca2+-binding EF-hand superfamily protein
LIAQYGPKSTFNYKQFCSILSVAESSFSQLLFDVVKEDGSKDSIDIHQLAKTLATLQFGTRRQRLELVFNAFDGSDDGVVDKAELTALLAAACSDNGIKMHTEEMEELAQSMIDSCQHEAGVPTESLSFDDFIRLVERHPRFLRALRIQGLASSVPLNSRNERIRMYKLYFRAYWKQALLITTFLAILLAALCFLMLYPATLNEEFYQIETASITLARLGAAFILAAATCILFPVTKLVTDKLRETRAVNFLNFDWAFNIHAVLGYVLLIAGIVHSVSWFFIYDAMASNPKWVADDPEFSGVSTFGAKERSFYGLCTSEVSITGYIMLGSIFLCYPFATKYPRSFNWVRETRLGALLNDFNAFFLWHRVMAVVFIVALLLHPLPGLPNSKLDGGSITWIFVAIPILLYLLNFVLLLRRIGKGKVEVVSYRMLKGKVLHLTLKRPDTRDFLSKYGEKGEFTFKAGQWLQLRVPGKDKIQIKLRATVDCSVSKFYFSRFLQVNR